AQTRHPLTAAQADMHEPEAVPMIVLWKSRRDSGGKPIRPAGVRRPGTRCRAPAYALPMEDAGEEGSGPRRRGDTVRALDDTLRGHRRGCGSVWPGGAQE